MESLKSSKSLLVVKIAYISIDRYTFIKLEKAINITTTTILLLIIVLIVLNYKLLINNFLYKDFKVALKVLSSNT